MNRNNEQIPDYYKVLEVSREADAETIKKSFKKLALKYHPDRNIGQETVSAEKFKLISEAYTVLSDQNKKLEYDRYVKDLSNNNNNNNRYGGGGVPQSYATHFDNIFEHFFRTTTPSPFAEFQTGPAPTSPQQPFHRDVFNEDPFFFQQQQHRPFHNFMRTHHHHPFHEDIHDQHRKYHQYFQQQQQQHYQHHQQQHQKQKHQHQQQQQQQQSPPIIPVKRPHKKREKCVYRLNQTIDISFAESIHGCEKTLSFPTKAACPECFEVICSHCLGNGLVGMGYCPTCGGDGYKKSCRLCDGTHEIETIFTDSLLVPAGINDKSKQEIYEMIQFNETIRDDYFVTVQFKVEQHPFFKRKDSSCHINVPVSITQALFGATLTIPTIHAQEIIISVPPFKNNFNNSNDYISILPRFGFKDPDGGGIGDMYIHFIIEMPTIADLSPREIELYKELDAIGANKTSQQQSQFNEFRMNWNLENLNNNSSNTNSLRSSPTLDDKLNHDNSNDGDSNSNGHSNTTTTTTTTAGNNVNIIHNYQQQQQQDQQQSNDFQQDFVNIVDMEEQDDYDE
ncbi:hypothetical protein CYY_001381 [Polysphondylium violaceum]|uniref:J domain-containing protein n=1 Tax=Polysphondylium violaceum TaxID=133409 RepID=A0A8J4Q157_9MYCE|nr:hypothetical protein CYY_001381 [Polysphondylium violaceum]